MQLTHICSIASGILLSPSASAMAVDHNTEIYQLTTLADFEPNATTETHDDAEPESIGWKILTDIQTVLTMIGMVANIITLITWICHGKGFPRISRILLQHQAIIDIIVCLMGSLINIQPRYFWMTGYETIDLLICQVWHGQALYWGCVLLSVWNLVFVIIERFVMIEYPYKHRNIQPKHTYIAFIIMYFFSVFLLIPAYLQVRYDREEGKCLYEYYFQTDFYDGFMSDFVIFWFMIVYAIPITIFLVLYTKIILTLRKRQQSQVGELYQRSPILETANQQMTRMVVVVEVVFILCLSWDSWFYLLGDIGINYVFNSKYQVIGVFLATFNSVANPFVYSATMSRFRQNLKKTLRCGE